MTMRNAVFWDVTPCGSCKNRLFGGKYRLHHCIRIPYNIITVYYHIVFLRSVGRLIVTANIVPSSPILVTLMMEALSSSEMSVLTRAIQRYNPEDDILHSRRHENLKSYRELTGWAL
jgi:hypothetical protein